MLQHPINVLVVAADEQTTRVVEDLVQGVNGHGFYLQRVVGLKNGLQALSEGGCDLCLLDITPIPIVEEEIYPTTWSPRDNNTVNINRFMRTVENQDPPIPLLILMDESVSGCNAAEQANIALALPSVRLDRSRTTPYLLERAICYALERANLLREITHLQVVDSLTGLLTEQTLDRLLEHELRRCKRYKYPAGLLVLRINQFDDVVADFGEGVGDQILRWIGMIIQENIRSVDYAGYYRKNQFVLLLPETPARSAVQVAQRLQMRVAGRPFVLFPDQGPVIELGVTISSGIAEGTNDSETAEGLLLMAERALKEAQRLKHSRIVVYGDVWTA